jgi:hypothetical protein
MISQDETRHRLIRLLQLAYSGEKAAALAYQGHSRSVRDPEEKAMIAKIERDERRGVYPGVTDRSRFLASLGMTIETLQVES